VTWMCTASASACLWGTINFREINYSSRQPSQWFTTQQLLWVIVGDVDLHSSRVWALHRLILASKCHPQPFELTVGEE
jgi:hypothetical protein